MTPNVEAASVASHFILPTSRPGLSPGHFRFRRPSWPFPIQSAQTSTRCCAPPATAIWRSRSAWTPSPRERRYVLCAVGRAEGGHIVMTPFGHLADGNPYDAYLPPDPDDPNGFITTPVEGAAA